MKFKGSARQEATEEVFTIAGEDRIMGVINRMEVRIWMKSRARPGACNDWTKVLW